MGNMEKGVKQGKDSYLLLSIKGGSDKYIKDIQPASLGMGTRSGEIQC